MTADLQEALAWAVADSSGAINVSTVSATERAAKVNWLYIGALQFIPNTMSDEAIEALWQRASKGHGVHLVAVRILTRSPAEGEECARLKRVIERDRSTAATILTAIKKAISGREWLRLGRGSYEYNDDRWRDEFSAAINEIEVAALKPLARLAGDLTDSPMKPDEIAKARSAEGEGVVVPRLADGLSERLKEDARGFELYATPPFLQIAGQRGEFVDRLYQAAAALTPAPQAEEGAKA